MAARDGDNGNSKKRVKGEGKVWVCDSFCGGRFHKKMTLFERPEQMTPEFAHFGEVRSRYRNGYSMPPEDIPTMAWETYPDYRVRNLTDFFTVDGFFIVSQRFVDTVAPFDLGNSSFHPMAFYHHDRTTRMEGSYYFFNLGSRRRCFIPDEEASGAVSKGGAMRREVPEFVEAQWTLCAHANNELAVTAEALTKPDFWIDPIIDTAFFLSGSLEVALREAKLIKGLSRWRCRILTDNAAQGATS